MHRVSIHAPTRDATCRLATEKQHLFVSIHAPTRDATQCFCLSWGLPLGFNPRAHEGRDPRSATTHSTTEGFNPRAHEGRDTATYKRLIVVISFNPRAHEGRD